MASKNPKGLNLIDNFEDVGEKITSSRDIIKTTVKITTFTSKEEKWVHHSYEETQKGRQLTSLKTTYDSAEDLENISSIIEALRDEEDSYSQSGDEEIKRIRIHEFLKKCKKKVEKRKNENNGNSESTEMKTKNEKIQKLLEDSNVTQSSSDEKDKSLNFVKNTEDNLKKELETILLQVYLEHLNGGQEIDIKIYERHINFCSESFNTKFNLYILQILGEKISLLVEYIKDRIYKNPEVNLLREKFYELKSERESQKEVKIPNNAKKNMSKSKSESVELNDKIRKVIKEMLMDLRDNVYSVLDASHDIRRIFNPILLYIIESKPDLFNFEDMHREEFDKWVHKDEFLKSIFHQIKVNAKNPSYEELHEILLEIEEILGTHNRDMTRFRSIIDMALEGCDSEDPTVRQICLNIGRGKNNPANSNFTNSKAKVRNSLYTCNHCSNKLHTHNEPVVSSFTTGNEAENSPPNKKDKFNDIDDLLDYINSNEDQNTKPKKQKRKGNKKKVAGKGVEGSLNPDKEKIEKEIQDFKNNIENNSVNAYKIRKIRPIISRSWLTSISEQFMVKPIN